MNLTEKENVTCETLHTFYSIQELFDCYVYFAQQSPILSILGIFLIIGIVISNIFLVCLIVRNKISVFDQIIIGHCIVDGLTGLVDVPLFYMAALFGYWPFGSSLALFWSSYDSNINTITNLHMLYMVYITLRSIQAPLTFKSEFFIKRPYLNMILFWSFGLLFWTPINILFGIIDFTISINYTPAYLQSIIALFSWFSILIGILILSIMFLYLLRKKVIYKSKKKPMKVLLSLKYQMDLKLAKFDSSNLGVNSIDLSKSQNLVSTNTERSRLKRERCIKLKPQSIFTIQIVAFLIQWLIPCFISLVQPICCCLPPILNKFYWLTYTVCFTDPLLILFFNPNINFKNSLKSSI